MAEHHRWQPGIGAFDEKEQLERILEHLEQLSTPTRMQGPRLRIQIATSEVIVYSIVSHLYGFE